MRQICLVSLIIAWFFNLSLHTLFVMKYWLISRKLSVILMKSKATLRSLELCAYIFTGSLMFGVAVIAAVGVVLTWNNSIYSLALNFKNQLLIASLDIVPLGLFILLLSAFKVIKSHKDKV